MIEVSVLHSFLKHQTWLDYSGVIDWSSLKQQTPEIHQVFMSVKKWHDTHDSDLSLAELPVWFFMQYPGKSDKQKEQYSALFQAAENIREELISQYLNQLRDAQVRRKIAVLAIDDKVSNAELIAQMGLIVPKTEEVIEDLRPEFVTNNLDELLQMDEECPGLMWRLECLNRSIGPVRKGMFGAILARVECLAKGTPVILSDGRTVAIETIKAGMSVMGRDSTARKVQATTKGHAQMYQITYPWGDSFVVNDNHILHLEDYTGREVNLPIVEYLKQSKKFKTEFRQVKVGIELPEKRLRIDPYILGVWLGDGSSDGPVFTNMDGAVIQSIQSFAQSRGLLCSVVDTPSRAKEIRVTGTLGGHPCNSFRNDLKVLHLLGNKHIPTKYLMGSKNQRYALLAGLLDTDGSRGKFGYEITQVRKPLAEQILWLARSLGLHSTLREKVVTSPAGVKVSYWRVAIYGQVHHIPVRIDYKQFKPTEKRRKQNLRFSFNVTPVGEGDYYGIYVDKDNLYLLGDFTITHNTGKTAMWVSEITNMVEQITDEQHIVVFFNEENGADVMWRIYSAITGMTAVELESNPQKGKELFEARGGLRIKFKEEATLYPKKVYQILDTLNPALIIIDSLDKIKGFDDERRDTALGKAYCWARETSKIYAPVIGVSQAVAPLNGYHKKWLTEMDMADSKTAKPGELDFLIAIGKSDDAGYEFVRYVNIPKNKRRGNRYTEEKDRHGKFQTIIVPELSIYKDC